VKMNCKTCKHGRLIIDGIMKVYDCRIGAESDCKQIYRTGKYTEHTLWERKPEEDENSAVQCL